MTIFHRLARRLVVVCAGAIFATTGLATSAYAEQHADTPYHELADIVTQRLVYADQVATAKWHSGVAVHDARQADRVVAQAVAQTAGSPLSPDWIRAIMTDQIGASEGVQYALFSQWSLIPSTAPATTVDLSPVRRDIARLTTELVRTAGVSTAELSRRDCRIRFAGAALGTIAAYHLDGLHIAGLNRALQHMCR